MSTVNQLKKAVQILRDRYEDEITESGDWYWNLDKWTINIVEDTYYKSVTAYMVKDGLTDWSCYITLEASRAEWRKIA